MYYIGVDLGGTNLRAAVVDTTAGEVKADVRGPTGAAEGPQAVIDRMVTLIGQVRQLLADDPTPVRAIGIGVPGVYDPATNHTRFLPNLATHWRDVPLGPEVAARTGLPAALVNDARAFVLAEATFGAGRGANIVVGMTLGTGIGGGVVIQGRLLMGIDGSAGEVGHQTIDPDGPICSCGNRGCLEAHTSGPAIASLGIKAVRQGRTTAIRGLVDGDLNRITPEVIVQAAEAGDPIAQEVLAEAGRALGIGVANLVTLFSPSVVVIGGGVAQAGEWLLRPVHEQVRLRCHVTPLDRVQIALAALGGEAGVIGAALWGAYAAQQAERV